MRNFSRLMFLAIILSLACGYIQAASYPNRPVSVILPMPAGGGADMMMRSIEQAAKKYLSQPLVVVYRPGAGGVIATTEVAGAKPDGYTVGFAVSGPMSTQPAMIDVPYDPDNDFDYVGGFAFEPILLAVRTDTPYKTLDEFLETARKTQLTWTSPGIGTVAHLSGALFLQKNGIKARMVPSSSGGEAVTNLLGGHVEFTFCHAAEVLSGYQAGEIAMFGVMDDKRIADLPEVPTFKELGMDFVFGVTRAFFLPKGVPQEAKDVLNKMLRDVLADKDFLEMMRTAHTETGYISPEDVKTKYSQDRKAYTRAVKDLGLR